MAAEGAYLHELWPLCKRFTKGSEKIPSLAPTKADVIARKIG